MNPSLRPDHLLEDLRSMEAVLGRRAAAVNRRIEVPILILALSVFPTFFIELLFTQGWLHPAAVFLNWVVWTAFGLESILLIFLTEHRLAYVRKAWLHLSVIPFAFPLLPHLSSGTSWETVVRSLRFIVLLAVFVQSCLTLYRVMVHVFFDLLAVARHPWIFLFGPLLRRRGLGLVVVVFWVLALIASLLHSYFEGRHPAEGLWWALVTLTTVGYGDITPVTLGGRITGGALMLSGIGVLAFITANVAAFFVEGDSKKELHDEVQSINKRLDQTNRRLDRIEELLSSDPPEKDNR